jgi:hypothetical protein
MDDRAISQFEKSAQEYYKESWEYFWAGAGVVVMLILVGCGIYFSKIAFSYWFGSTPGSVEDIFAWAASIAISCIEIAAIKLLGNKIRSAMIRENNKLEHKMVTYFVWGLFLFDIWTNIYGLWLTANKIHPDIQIFSIGTLLILGLASLMACSEIFVGWMLRAVAVGYVGWMSAKTKYDAYKQKVEADAQENINREMKTSSFQNYQDNNKPQQKTGQHQNPAFNMKPANFSGNQNRSQQRPDPTQSKRPILSPPNYRNIITPEFEDDNNDEERRWRGN